MSSLTCESDNQVKFTSETMLHFHGLGNVDNPGITVCRKVLVCLVCGFSRFMIPEPELTLLANGTRNSELPFRHSVATPFPAWTPDLFHKLDTWTPT